MDVREYIDLARRWLWLLVLAAAVSAVSAWVATRFMAKQYASQTTLLVGRSMSSADPNLQNVYLSLQLANVYVTMVSQEPVLKGVVDQLKLDWPWQALSGMVKASQEPGSPLITIRVIDSVPERAQVIASAVADQLIEQSPTPTERKNRENAEFLESQIRVLKEKITKAEPDLADIDRQIALETSARSIADLQTRKDALLQQLESWRGQMAQFVTASQGSETNSLSVLAPASPGELVGPNVKANVLLAALLGLVLAIGGVMILEYLDDTVKTPAKLQQRLGITGLGAIELVAGNDDQRDLLPTQRSPRSAVAEAFRLLRTNLQFSLLRKPHVALAVTSANPGEGKSTVSANLAVSTAQGGQSVLLVDGDLRRPSVHRFFGLDNNVGLTSMLFGEGLEPQKVVQAVEGLPELQVITSGPLPPNPAELLASDDMQALMQRLRTLADVVIIDSPPVLAVADAVILAQEADGVLLVFEAGQTRVDAARHALESLQRVGVTPVGAVINKLDLERLGDGYYGYGYRYHQYYQASDGGGNAGGGDGQAGDLSAPRGNQGLIDRLRAAVSALLS